jgi:hypothetical protein
VCQSVEANASHARLAKRGRGWIVACGSWRYPAFGAIRMALMPENARYGALAWTLAVISSSGSENTMPSTY